jgi:hypothetical protein
MLCSLQVTIELWQVRCAIHTRCSNQLLQLCLTVYPDRCWHSAGPYFVSGLLFVTSCCYFLLLLLAATSCCYFLLLLLVVTSCCYFLLLLLAATSCCYFFLLLLCCMCRQSPEWAALIHQAGTVASDSCQMK